MSEDNCYIFACLYCLHLSKKKGGLDKCIASETPQCDSDRLEVQTDERPKGKEKMLGRVDWKSKQVL